MGHQMLQFVRQDRTDTPGELLRAHTAEYCGYPSEKPAASTSSATALPLVQMVLRIQVANCHNMAWVKLRAAQTEFRRRVKVSQRRSKTEVRWEVKLS